MNLNGRPKGRYLVDGRRMTVDEIAEMLGISKNALRVRKARLGGASYQVIADLYRSNQLGRDGDRAWRYLIEGRWMTRAQIAEMLGVRATSISTWRSMNRASMAEAVEHFREWNRRGRVPNPAGGRPAKLYPAGGRMYTVQQVADRFGVCRSSVQGYLVSHDGDMAATIRHYREKDKRAKARAEAEILRILGF